MKNDKKILGDYSPDVTPTPLSPTGDTPIDFYSWGDQTSIGLTSRKKQMEDGLEAAFDSIEITEDTSTSETDYVLKVLGKDAGRVIVSVDSIIKNAYYDKTTQELVIVIRITETTDKEIRINVKDLIDVYTGDGVTIQVDDKNVISITKEVMDTFTDLYREIAQETETRESEDEKLQTAIETETSERKTEDSKLQAAIESEETDRKSADEALESKLTEETSNRKSEDEKLDGKINTEIADRKSEDEKLEGKIDTEISDRKSEDEKLQGNIDKVEADSKKYTDDTVKTEKERAESVENEIKESKADKEHTHEIADIENLQTVLDNKLNITDIESIPNELIYKLFKTVAIDSDKFMESDTTDNTQSYAFNGDGDTVVMTSSKLFNGNKVEIENLTLETDGSVKSVLDINASTVKLDAMNLTGAWVRKVGGNALVTIGNSEEVSLENVTVDRTGGYNVFEIGLDGKGTSKSIVIDGLEINSAISNNGINIFSFADDANIVIKNCHFAEVSNPIRISNMTYAKNVSITIKDCTFDKWESGYADYAGLILLQDHTSANYDEFDSKNPFGSFSITLDNVTGPYGKIESGQAMEDICASHIANKQLVYMYVDKASPRLIPYSELKYPTIIIK